MLFGIFFSQPLARWFAFCQSLLERVLADAGPADDPLVRAGAAIIEGRYRGRGATWHIARSVVEPATYLIRGGYVHPLDENQMAYPPRAAVNAEAVAAAAAMRTPGFPGAAPVHKVVRAHPQVEPPATKRFELGSPPVSAPAQLRRPGARPTPANESAYKKTG